LISFLFLFNRVSFALGMTQLWNNKRTWKTNSNDCAYGRTTI